MGYVPGMAYPAEPPVRPVAVTVIAIVGIVVGALALLFLPVNIMHAATGWRSAGPTGPMMWANPTFRTYTLVAMPISAIACVLYIVAAIGMLQLRPWARTLAVGLIIFAMIYSLVGMMVTLPQMGSMIEAAMRSTPTSGPMPNMSFMKPIIYVVAGFMALIGLGVKITFIVLLTRPNVVQAFEPARASGAPAP